jgi:hypothetical protein
MTPKLSVRLAASVLLLGVWACVKVPPSAPLQSGVRIGVYDSRALAIAWAGTPSFNEWMAPLLAAAAKAKEAGDAKRLKELEAEGEARQQRLHLQGFSTAPVDEILEPLKDSLPGIQQQAGVSALVSKWDKKSLARYPAAVQIDVTMALVDALQPGARQRQYAIDAQKHTPMPLEKARQMRDW